MTVNFSPFQDLCSKRLILSYTEGSGGGSMGGNSPDNVIQVVKFPAERMSHIKGNKITYIRFNMWDRFTHVSELKVFIGTKRDQFDLVCQNVQSLHPGWNQVKLDEPYVITGDSIFVGVNYTISEEDVLYPVKWDSGSGKEEGACILFREGAWSESEGTWHIQCLVEGDDIPKYDLHVTNLEGPLYKRFVKAGENYECKLHLKNWGSMPINSYEMECQLNGKNVANSHYQSISRTPGPQEIYVNVTPDNDFEVGRYTLTISPKLLNGEEFKYADENKKETMLSIYEHDMGRQKVLIQNYTGTWCGYCAEFDEILDNKNKERDDLVILSIHSGDKYSTPADDSYLSMLYSSGIPNVDLNRCVWQILENYREWTIKYSLDDAKNQPSFANVNIKANSLENSPKVDIVVSGDRNEDFVPIEGWTNLTVLLVEDSIKGYQNGSDLGPDFTHNNVIRKNISEIWGDLVEWDGDHYEKHYYVILDDQWKKENMRIVAFLSKPFTGDNYDEIHVLNCNDLSLREKLFGDINGDGEVNVTDVVTLINYIAKDDFSGVDKSTLDLNGDGNVDVTDVVTLILMIGKG
ncbi:MAG: Omp28-related outer membrane protein [Prevotella sp.]|nr:Omp28-related outer membrane protein [Prevotella sp.]